MGISTERLGSAETKLGKRLHLFYTALLLGLVIYAIQQGIYQANLPLLMLGSLMLVLFSTLSTIAAHARSASQGFRAPLS